MDAPLGRVSQPRIGTTIRNRHRPKGNGHQLIANTDSTQRAQYATRLNQRGRLGEQLTNKPLSTSSKVIGNPHGNPIVKGNIHKQIVPHKHQ